MYIHTYIGTYAHPYVHMYVCTTYKVQNIIFTTLHSQNTKMVQNNIRTTIWYVGRYICLYAFVYYV